MSQYKIRKLGLKYGKYPFQELIFKPGKYSRDEIKKLANELSEKWAEKGVTGYMFVSLLYPEGWRGGSQTKIGDNVRLFTYADSDNDNPDPEYYPEFSIFIVNFNKAKGGDSIHNDCLFDCLVQLIPAFYKNPANLKKFLGLNRNDKVPLEKFPLIEERYPNCNIHVSGDYEYETKNKGKIDCYLKLVNEHYKLDYSKIWSVKGISLEERQPIVSIISPKDPNRRLVYDGNKIGTVKKEFVENIRKYPIFDPIIQQPQRYLLVKCEDGKTLKETYDKFIREADLLKKATNGVINLYQTGSLSKSAMKLFNDFNKGIVTEPLSEQEQQWIRDSSSHQMIWCVKYEGEIYYYDVVSMYPTILRYTSFGIPIKKGTFKTITQEELDKMKFFEYGIYHCDIENTNTKLFLTNPKKYYTHFDLMTAKELGFKIQMIQDDKSNVLLYPGETRISGSHMFSKYTDFLFPLKQSKNEELSKLSKNLLNVIWGKLCEKNKFKLFYDVNKNGDKEIPSDHEIYSISKNENNIIVKHGPKNKIFETNFARLEPFILARGRRMISKIMEPHIDEIVRVHTDGFFSKTRLNFKKTSQSLDSVKIGTNFGDLKEVYHKNIIVHNAIKFNDNSGNKSKRIKWEKIN